LSDYSGSGDNGGGDDVMQVMVMISSMMI